MHRTETPLACLPWYDFEELRPLNDRLWSRIRSALDRRGFRGAPDRLNRSVAYESQWTSKRLLLGQACGYDALIAFRTELKIVATPQFHLDGCSGHDYRSFVIVRRDSNIECLAELRGARCVINTPTSHSGTNILRALVAPFARAGQFFSEVVVSGAHEHSIELLHRRRADVAAIDCVTYGLLERYRPGCLDGTRIIERTKAVPAPPFVTSRQTPDSIVALLRDTIEESVPFEPLGLGGVVNLELDDYSPIARLEASAAASGYHLLPPCAAYR